MEWDHSLDTGEETIDEQHKTIVDFINELHEAVQTGNRDKVSKVLDGLIEYSVLHFSYEEELMQKTHYPLIESHIESHQAFITRVHKHRLRHEKGKDIARTLSGELQIWLTHHIKVEDADFTKMLDLNSGLSGLVKKIFG